MNLKLYQVDAFSEKTFGGNPAAVVLLATWLPSDVLQAIAEENNLSETAFYVPKEAGYELRWFTPVSEVDLCGHATLAAAHVLFTHENVSGDAVSFQTRSGELVVRRSAAGLEMNFPAKVSAPVETPELLVRALGVRPLETLVSDDYIAVLENEESVRSVSPSMSLLGELDLRGVVVTAPGRDADFVSRFFAPKLGVPEDPVTGSAHCELAPYWGKRLNLITMRAFQCSRRGGEVRCTLLGDRVLLAGSAVTFMRAEIYVET